MTYYEQTYSNFEAPRRLAGPPAGLGQALGILRLWIARHRQRRHLRLLEPHLLADIGRDSGAAMREAAKPFWQD